MGGTAVFGGLAWWMSSAGDSSYKSYRTADSVSTANSLHAQTSDSDRLYSIFAYTAIGVYSVNLLDAMFLHRPKSALMGGLTEMDLALMPGLQGSNSWKATLSWRI